jgi:hypothetical protein
VQGGVLVGGRRVKEGDEGDGIWLMDFIYLYETELKNLLQLIVLGGAGMLGNTETMQMLELLECQDNTAYLPNPNDLPTHVQHLPHSPSQPSYLMPIPLQPPSSHHRMFKIPSLQKKHALTPLRVLL